MDRDAVGPLGVVVRRPAAGDVVDVPFAVEQAHARGLELHAWFNPFRAGNRSDTARFAPTHVWNARRDLARIYGQLRPPAG